MNIKYKGGISCGLHPYAEYRVINNRWICTKCKKVLMAKTKMKYGIEVQKVKNHFRFIYRPTNQYLCELSKSDILDLKEQLKEVD